MSRLGMVVTSGYTYLEEREEIIQLLLLGTTIEAHAARVQ